MNDETVLSYPVSLAPTHTACVGLSIVIPVYRGAATIGRLVEALSALHPVGGLEIVLVNDGSPDNSGEVCQELVRCAAVPLTYVEHARNFGEHNAVMTGLRHARGAYTDHDGRRPAESARGGDPALRPCAAGKLGRRLHPLRRQAACGLAQPRQQLRQCGGGPPAGQAEGPLPLVVPLHVGVRGAVGDTLSGALPVHRRAAHAGDAADRQHRGAPSAARSRVARTTISHAWCGYG